MTNDETPTAKRRTRREDLRARPDAFAFTFADAIRMSGIGRTKLYELGRAGQLRLVKVAGRTLIEGDSLRELLRGAAASHAA